MNYNPIPDFIDLEWDWLGEETQRLFVPFAIQNGYEVCSVVACWNHLMCNKTSMMVGIIYPLGWNPRNTKMRLDTAHSILLQVADNFEKASGVDHIVCFTLFNYFNFFSLNGED
jgi:hypothetical protein